MDKVCCRGSAGEAPGMEQCQGLARNLLEAASLGADPPLSQLLPHTRVMLNSNKGEQHIDSLQAFTAAYSRDSESVMSC